MATFGNINLESLNKNITGQCRGNAFASGGTGTGNFIMVYLDDWDAGWDVQCCLYRKSDGVIIKLTESRSTGGGAGWYQFDFPAPLPSILNIDYGLCARGEFDAAKSEVTNMKYSATSAYRYYKNTELVSFPNPFDGTEGTTNYLYSIYCDYTPTGGLSVPVAMHHYNRINKIIRG